MPESAKVIRLDLETQRHVRGRLARLPAPAHAVHERSKQLLARRLEVFFDSADDALFDMADKASSNQEQNLFFDSMREVRVQRKGIEKRFFEGVDEALARLVDADDRDSVQAEGELSAEALSLVQNDDLEQLVALESTVARANRDMDLAVKRLSYGLTPLVPHQVSIQTNPFGPEMLCGLFMGQIKRLDIDIKAKLVLFKLFDRVVIGELSAIYKSLESVLLEHGVDIRSPSIAARSASKVPSTKEQSSSEFNGLTHSGFDGSHSGFPLSEEPSHVSPSSGYLVPQEQSFNQALGSPNQSMAPGGFGSVTGGGHATPAGCNGELLNLLSFVQKLPAAVTANKNYGVEQVLQRVQKHKGTEVNLGGVEHETIRLVEMLFEFILRDEALAPSIKEMLCRLQIPVLKVALMDKNFLSDKRHTVRLLLNEMASQAVGLQSEDEVSEPLVECIRRVIDSVLNDFGDDVSVFQDALAEFSSFVEKDRRRSSVLERRMVDAESGKARAETARKAVSKEVDARISRQKLPEPVKQLLVGPLSNVLFVTGLKHGFDSAPWEAHLDLVEDLIWSVVAGADRKKLIATAPGIVKRMRNSLDAISYNPFEVSEMINAIEDIHVARIRGERLSFDEAPELKAVKDKALDDEAVESVEPTEQQAQSEVTPQPEQLNQGEKTATTQTGPLSGSDPHMQTVAAFSQGSWFDFVEQSGTVRCRLAAYIKPTGKYIFVNRSGMKVAEHSQQDLAFGLKAGSFRAVDNSMLFDRALENIVSGMRTSKPASPLEGGRLDNTPQENGRSTH